MMARLLALVLLLAGPATAAAADRAASDAARFYGKARAPARIEWVSSGDDGAFVADVYPESDYERLELVWVVPGRRDLRRREVHDAGPAGEPLRVEWAATADGHRPRLLVIMVVDGRRMKRAGTPPGAEIGTPSRERAGRVDRDAGLRVMPAVREPAR